MSDIHKEVQEVLSQNRDNISFEEVPNQESSPLNQAVVEKDIGGAKEAAKESVSLDGNVEEVQREEPPHKEDAPEQEINEDHSEAIIVDTKESFELPPAHARQAADTVLGMANNMLETGGGYFVKIRRHKEFYEFEEIILLIDKQNDKNVQRIKLDKEDQILLRPLLIQVLKTKAKKLTPEQQLMGAIISIGIKKAQVVMEVRAENEILTERILDIVREEKGYSEQDEEEADSTNGEREPEPEPEIKPDALDTSDDSFYEQAIVIAPLSPGINPDQVMEIAEDQSETPNKSKS